MVKHTQAIRRQVTERLSAYNYFIVQSASKKKLTSMHLLTSVNKFYFSFPAILYPFYICFISISHLI